MRKGILPILCLAILPCTCPAPVFIKLGDIKGESKHADHEEWVDVISVDIGIEAISTETTTKRKHEPLTIIKPIDKASPLLMQNLAGGTSLGEVLVDYTLPDGASRATFKLRNAFVTAMEFNGDPDSPIITGKIQVDYSYAEWHVRQYGSEGTVIDRAATYYDMLSNEAGELSNAPRILQAGNMEVGSGTTFTVDITVLDEDTAYEKLSTDVQVDASAMEVGPIRWMAPEMLRISLTTKPTYSGQSTVTLKVSDGEDATFMSFSVYVDDTGTPWGGFIDAYFSEEEQLNTFISGPLGDPDEDQMSTLMEFLFGTNPREYTPPERQIRKQVFHLPGPGGGDPDPILGLEFLRRIDEPTIQLSLYGSPDGETWTQLRDGEGDPPLYEEYTGVNINPIYEEVEGTIKPPDGVTSYFIRFVAEM